MNALRDKSITRRQLCVAGIVGTATSFAALTLRAAPLPAGQLFKTPTCGCCSLYVAYLGREGLSVTVTDMPDLTAIKRAAGVPRELESCHTMQLGNYVIEGHVPVAAIRRLLTEAPRVRGLAVPGMPVGSPGMEGPNPERYDVIAFDASGPRGRYMRF